MILTRISLSHRLPWMMANFLVHWIKMHTMILEMTPAGRRTCPSPKPWLWWKAVSKYKLPKFDHHLSQALLGQRTQPRDMLFQTFLGHRIIRRGMYTTSSTTCKANLVTRPRKNQPQSPYYVRPIGWDRSRGHNDPFFFFHFFYF